MCRPPARDIAQTRRGVRVLLLDPGQVQVTALIHNHSRTGVDSGAGSTGYGDILAPAGGFTPTSTDVRRRYRTSSQAAASPGVPRIAVCHWPMLPTILYQPQAERPPPTSAPRHVTRPEVALVEPRTRRARIAHRARAVPVSCPKLRAALRCCSRSVRCRTLPVLRCMQDHRMPVAPVLPGEHHCRFEHGKRRIDLVVRSRCGYASAGSAATVHRLRRKPIAMFSERPPRRQHTRLARRQPAPPGAVQRHVADRCQPLAPGFALLPPEQETALWRPPPPAHTPMHSAPLHDRFRRRVMQQARGCRVLPDNRDRTG